MKTAPNIPRVDTVSIEIPRAALTVTETAHRVSQHNSERAIGIKAAAFLELARDFGREGGDVLVAGRARLVEPEPFLRWLARRRQETAPANDTPTDLEAMADELGVRLAVVR